MRPFTEAWVWSLPGMMTVGTDMEASDDYNRVVSADLRSDFGEIYYAQLQLAGPNGYARSEATNSNAFRVDWLAAYQPAPGTALFFGYGSGFTEPNALTFRQLRRSADGVFVKLSYLLRS